MQASKKGLLYYTSKIIHLSKIIEKLVTRAWESIILQHCFPLFIKRNKTFVSINFLLQQFNFEAKQRYNNIVGRSWPAVITE